MALWAAEKWNKHLVECQALLYLEEILSSLFSSVIRVMKGILAGNTGDYKRVQRPEYVEEEKGIKEILRELKMCFVRITLRSRED